MNKSDYGHKPIESTGGKAKRKHTAEKHFKVEVIYEDGTLMLNRDIAGYTAIEVLGIIELLRENILTEIRNNNLTKPAARDKGDDML